jgi:hypothetical protein
MRTLLYALAMATAVALTPLAAQAGYVATLAQAESNVLATGSGTIDLAGLTFSGLGSADGAIEPSAGVIITGPESGGLVGGYTGLTEPASFGKGSATFAMAEAETSLALAIPSLTKFSYRRATSPAAPCRTARPTAT